MKRNFQETVVLLKKGAKKGGIDFAKLEKDPVDYKSPPTPNRFPLYKSVAAWRTFAHGIAFIIQQEFHGATSDSVEDIGWYANLLPVKVYRQLCTRWELRHQPIFYSDVDHAYTRYILKEIIRIMKHAIEELLQVSTTQKADLMLLLSKLSVYEPRILKL